MPSLVLPVLGLPIHFDADTPALGDAVEAAFGAWRRFHGHPELVTPLARPPRVDLRLAESALRPRAPGPLLIRTPSEGRLRLTEPGRVAGGARVDRLTARLRVAPRALDHTRSIRHALDTLTLFLLTRLDREPLHAAAIADSHGRGLVLAGPSGIGKSTLALAALRAGLRVLTDDAVYLQLEPRLRVWGMGRPLHVLPGTAGRFPDLGGGAAVSRPGGKIKIPVELSGSGGDRGGAGVLERVGLCLLEPGTAAPAEPVPADEAARTLVDRLDPGFDAFAETIPERIRALAKGGAWRVRVGYRPEAALPTLLDLLRKIDDSNGG